MINFICVDNMEVSFFENVRNLVKFCNENPSLLEGKHPEIKDRLSKCCGKGQGTGNKATDHEASFAKIVEDHGFTHIQVGDEVTKFAYIYQPHGTQKSIDFRLLSPSGKAVDIDLKHSENDAIFLNDGKFLTDVIYVISFTRVLKDEKVKGQRKCPRQNVCTIVLGQDVMTPKDATALEKRYVRLRELNEETKDLDFLTIYARNANQYSCKQFTAEFNTNSLKKIITFLQ